MIFPGIYYLTIRLAKWYAKADDIPTKELFLKYAYMLVPMGLLAWIAFSVPLIMVNGSYIISVISDPMGWGMNLFGTADFPWTPLRPNWVPYLQVPILLTGLYYGLRGLYEVGRKLFWIRYGLETGLIRVTRDGRTGRASINSARFFESTRRYLK